jgi:predicted enzyme related to lactoylglutathione lyase
MRPQPLIAVSDVEASSRWYQRLLGCRSDHGGPAYERLVSNGVLILQLHRFDVEHHHGRIGDPLDKPYGNGLLLWFEIEDFDAAVARAEELQAQVVLPRHRNPPDGDGGPNHWECWLRDPDGYIVVIASPDGSADGNWKPAPTHTPTRGLYGWITHTELVSTDSSATRNWCESVFGWSFKMPFPSPGGGMYHLFAYSEKGGGGVRQAQPGETPGSSFSVHVEDTRASFDKAIGAGAEAVVPPTRIMDGVTIAIVRAPGGVPVGLSGP